LGDIRKAHPELSKVDITTDEFGCHVSDDKMHGWSHGKYTMHMKDKEGSEFKKETVRFTHTLHRKQAQDPWMITHAHTSQGRDTSI
jgi:hypothetical protein